MGKWSNGLSLRCLDAWKIIDSESDHIEDVIASSQFMLLPMELIVLLVRLTVSPDIYPSLSIAISKIYRDGGVGSFYAGISPTLMGMLPYSTCYYFMYEN